MPDSTNELSPFPLDSRDATSAKLPQLAESSQDRNISVSRLFPSSPDAQMNSNKQAGDRISSPSFQPPAGSRLLAFARAPPKAGNPLPTQPMNGESHCSL